MTKRYPKFRCAEQAFDALAGLVMATLAAAPQAAGTAATAAHNGVTLPLD